LTPVSRVPNPITEAQPHAATPWSVERVSPRSDRLARLRSTCRRPESDEISGASSRQIAGYGASSEGPWSVLDSAGPSFCARDIRSAHSERRRRRRTAHDYRGDLRGYIAAGSRRPRRDRRLDAIRLNVTAHGRSPFAAPWRRAETARPTEGERRMPGPAPRCEDSGERRSTRAVRQIGAQIPLWR
jgi:hypothetical protein